MLTKTESRDRQVLRLRDEGRTNAEIGSTIGVTKERVRQIVSRAEKRKRQAPPRCMADEYLRKLQQAGPIGRFYLDNTDLGPLCSVYFLYSPATNLVKIGSSIDPYSRTAPMVAMSPLPMHLVGYVVAQRRDEVLLHEQFTADRAHGEWFRLGIRLRARIEELLSSEYGVRLYGAW